MPVTVATGDDLSALADRVDALEKRTTALERAGGPTTPTRVESAAGTTVTTPFSTLEAAIAGKGILVDRNGGLWRLVASASNGNQIEVTMPDSPSQVDAVTAQVSRLVYGADHCIWQQAQASNTWYYTPAKWPTAWSQSASGPPSGQPTPPIAAGMAIALNTHINFGFTGLVPPYANTAAFIRALKYIWGTKAPLLRDFPMYDEDQARWQAIHDATGALFIATIPEDSPAGQDASLARMPALAAAGLLYAIEGGNEEDDAYPQSLGATLADTAKRQERVYAMGKQLGLPSVNMSFGAGWTAANDWAGNYDKVGDLSPYCDYANAHTYPQPGQDVAGSIQRLNGLALMAAKSRPVWITEIGWTTADVPNEAQRAQLVTQSINAAKAAGSALGAWYAAVDDTSGKWGLFNDDWTPRASATALRDYLAAM